MARYPSTKKDKSATACFCCCCYVDVIVFLENKQKNFEPQTNFTYFFLLRQMMWQYSQVRFWFSQYKTELVRDFCSFKWRRTIIFYRRGNCWLFFVCVIRKRLVEWKLRDCIIWRKFMQTAILRWALYQ